MGLDTYALPSEHGKLSKKDMQAFKEAGIRLCGGILSGYGDDGSFRGKVYSDTIHKITGYSLYQDWIPPEDVVDMYQKLKLCRHEDYQGHEEDIENLRKFFKVCVERKLGLWGWW